MSGAGPDSEPGAAGPSDAGLVASPLFFSYARKDQAAALRVIRALEASGHAVWWDGLIEGGARFAAQTEQALQQAPAVIVAWSKDAVASHWVNDEATSGRDRGVLVPVSLDGSGAPIGFRQFQVIDLSHWTGDVATPEFQRVLRGIEAARSGQGVLDSDPALASTALAPAPAAPSSALSRRGLLVGAGAGAVALAGFGAWQLGLFGNGGPTPNSVAVLPFVSDSATPDYIAAGLSAELRAELSRNAALRVAAQASSAAARELNVDAQTMAGRLRVAFLLDGNVRVVGDELRIAAELIDGATGIVSWSKSFARRKADILAVQGEIARAVASALTSVIEPAGSSAVPVGGTANVAAYDAYLQGRDLYSRANSEAMDMAALAQFDAAVAADPRFAAAHAARARSLVLIGSLYGDLTETRANYAAALVSARRAVALAPEHAESQSTLGLVLSQGHLDMRAARAPFDRARELGNGDANVLAQFAQFSARTGRFDDARAAIDRAITLDPLNPLRLTTSGQIAYFARDNDAALAGLQQALSQTPDMSEANAWQGDVLLALGRHEEAREAYAREPSALLRETGLAIVLFRLGQRGAAESARRRVVAGLGTNQVTDYQQAQIAAQWNEPDVAMAALASARAAGDSGLVALKVDPLLDPLRSRPDFRSLLNALHFD